MPAKLSIVIPTLNAEAELPRCLTALMEGLHAGLIRELIVSDGGSNDATCRMVEEAGAVLVQGPPSRGGQLRRGCAAARGEWLLVLHADTELAPGWAKIVVEHLEDSRAPAHFRLAFRASGFWPSWVAGWANLRSAVFGLPYGDQGLLISAAEYRRTGGYREQPLMEDVEMVRALPKPLVALPALATTGADRYVRAGWLRRGARNLWTLTRYFLGADPQRLADSYRK